MPVFFYESALIIYSHYWLTGIIFECQPCPINHQYKIKSKNAQNHSERFFNINIVISK